MKKTKLLIPLTAIAGFGAFAPIVTLASCGKKASITTIEKDYLDTINAYLTKVQDIYAPHKAIETLKEIGYDVVNYHLADSSCEFAFDATCGKFVIMSGDSLIAGPNTNDYQLPDNKLSIFKFTSKYNKNSSYSQYLLDNYDYTFTSSSNPFEVTTGIDVGNNTNIKYMKYVGDSKVKKTVLLRTYSEVLQIDAQEDTIYHMNVANNVWVEGNSNKCTYNEVGGIGYLWANNATLNFLSVDSRDQFSVDVLEVGTKTVKGENWDQEETDDRITCVVGITKPEGYTKGKWNTITEVESESELVAALKTNQNAFIRLTQPIEIKDTTTTIAISGSKLYKYIDLAGHNITDGATLTSGNTLIEVNGGASMLLLDSERTGEIQLKDKNIQIVGDASNWLVSTLYLDGVKITYEADNSSAAIRVGETTTTVTKSCPYDAKIYMYGGSITSTKKSGSTTTTSPYGIWTRANSYVQILYGKIVSTEICIGGLASQDGVYIDIVDGEFESKNSFCFYLPEYVTLHIAGGYYEGKSIIGFKDGDISISGGTFIATGEYTPIESTGGTQVSDGSVIIMDCHSDAAYGLTPYITVTKAKMFSKNAYIFHGLQSNAFTGLGEADFFGGQFIYSKGNGYVIPDVTTERPICRILFNQWGGSWSRQS